VVVQVKIYENVEDDELPATLTEAFYGSPPSSPELIFPPEHCSFKFVGTTASFDCVRTGVGAKFVLTRKIHPRLNMLNWSGPQEYANGSLYEVAGLENNFQIWNFGAGGWGIRRNAGGGWHGSTKRFESATKALAAIDAELSPRI